MKNVEVSELIALLPKAFLPEMAGDIAAILQINANGKGGGDWIVEIKDKKCMVEKGVTKNPDLALSASTVVINDVFTGELDAMRAFMQGKIQFKGNMGLAMKFSKLFRNWMGLCFVLVKHTCTIHLFISGIARLEKAN